MSTYHVLLTRFNVKRGPIADPKAISFEWLQARANLFSDVTVPSVLNQTRLPDLWLVFFDEATPIEFRAVIKRFARSVPMLRAVFCDVCVPAVYIEALSGFMPKETEQLITTRLDSDDAIEPRLLERVRAAAADGRRRFINPMQGLIVHDGRLYRKRDFSSPFISFSESAVGFVTVWVDQHQRLSRHGYIQQIDLPNAWLQVVHGGNIANQVRGIRVRETAVNVQHLPMAVRRQLKPTSVLELLLDNSLGLCARYSRSFYRRVRRELSDRGM